MKKVVLALGFVAALALATPSPAHAHFSLGIALPGFGLFVHEPCPRPFVYAPPVYYRPPVVYYQPAPVVYPYGYARYGRYRHDNGWHRGWYKHHRDWDDD